MLAEEGNGEPVLRSALAEERKGVSVLRSVAPEERKGVIFLNPVASEERNDSIFLRSVEAEERKGAIFLRSVAAEERKDAIFLRSVAAEERKDAVVQGNVGCPLRGRAPELRKAVAVAGKERVRKVAERPQVVVGCRAGAGWGQLPGGVFIGTEFESGGWFSLKFVTKIRYISLVARLCFDQNTLITRISHFLFLARLLWWHVVQAACSHAGSVLV